MGLRTCDRKTEEWKRTESRIELDDACMDVAPASLVQHPGQRVRATQSQTTPVIPATLQRLLRGSSLTEIKCQYTTLFTARYE
eukprot:3196973-Rhodomonas_salina.3